MAYSSPAQLDLNAKYATANAELNQLYSLATTQLPVAPDAVIQALIMCRTSLTGLMPGQTQPYLAPGSAAAPSAAPLMQHPPEPEVPTIPPVSMYQPPAEYRQQSIHGGTRQPAPQAAPMAGYAPPAALPMAQPISGHAHGGVPPMPPAVLMPQGTYQSVAPQSVAPPPEQANFTRRADGWPPRSYHKSLGEAYRTVASEAHLMCVQKTKILALATVHHYGQVRHEVIIEKRCIGRILGKGGRDLAAMKESSGAEVFIIDKEPPPGVDEDHRMLIIIGTPDNVNSCLVTVNKTLERASTGC